MLQNHQLLSIIGKKSWSNREKFLADNPNAKFLNAYSIYELLQEPKDWLSIATKCSENPNHEHFDKDPEAILEIWNTKKEKKAKDGNTLDDYIELKLKKNNLGQLLTFKQVEIDNENFSLVEKCNNFDKLEEDLLKKLNYLTTELWLTSENGINLRCDALFSIPDIEKDIHHAVVMEWKSLDKVSMTNHWNKLIGPLEGYDDCDKTKFTLQTHLYRYIIESFGIFSKIMTNIYNFNTLSYQHIPQAFPYSKEKIEEILEYCKNKQSEQFNSNEK
jgi:hypothetical protein